MDTNTIDARGARLAIRTYLKWAWVPVIALVGGFFVGSTISSNEQVVGEAELVVGLTEEVRWPFFDAVLARQQGLIDDNGLLESVSEETGIEGTSVEVITTNAQNSTLTVAISVNGSSAEAQTFADALGEQLVQVNIDAQSAAYVEEAALLQADLEAQQILQAEYEAEIEGLTAQWVLLQDQIVIAEPEDLAELRAQSTEVDRARRVADRRLDGVIAFQTTLDSQLAQAQRDVGRTASPVEVSASATAVEASSTDLGPVLAVMNFLLALLAVPFMERMFGRMNSVDQAGVVFPTSKLIDARRSASVAVDPVDVVGLSVKSAAADAAAARPTSRPATVAVAELKPSAKTLPMLESIASFGAEASVVNVGATEGLAQAIDSDQLVVIVPVRSISMDDVRTLAEELEQLGTTPDLVVLTKKPSRSQRTPAPVGFHGERASVVEKTEQADVSKVEAEPTKVKKSKIEPTKAEKSEGSKVESTKVEKADEVVAEKTAPAQKTASAGKKAAAETATQRTGSSPNGRTASNGTKRASSNGSSADGNSSNGSRANGSSTKTEHNGAARNGSSAKATDSKTPESKSTASKSADSSKTAASKSAASSKTDASDVKADDKPAEKADAKPAEKPDVKADDEKTAEVAARKTATAAEPKKPEASGDDEKESNETSASTPDTAKNGNRNGTSNRSTTNRSSAAKSTSTKSTASKSSATKSAAKSTPRTNTTAKKKSNAGTRAKRAPVKSS